MGVLQRIAGRVLVNESGFPRSHAVMHRWQVQRSTELAQRERRS